MLIFRERSLHLQTQPLRWPFYTILCFCLETELPRLLPCQPPLQTTAAAMIPSMLVIPLVLMMMLLLPPPEEVVEEVRSVVVRPLV